MHVAVEPHWQEHHQDHQETRMGCDHGTTHIAQLAYTAPGSGDDVRACGLAAWCTGARLEGLDPEPVEVGYYVRDYPASTHCGTVEVDGGWWDIYLAHSGTINTTRTRWETVTNPATGEPGYLPTGPETVELAAPFVSAIPQPAPEPLDESVRLAVAAAAEPRLMTATEGYLVERCVRAALDAVQAR